MPTHVRERAGVGDSVKHVAEHASMLARLELELALAEMKKKVVRLGLGIALAVGAGIFALLGLGFAFAAIAAAIAIVLPTSAAIGITTGALFGLAAVLGGVGFALLKRGSPPVPDQAIEEAKLTAEALRSNGSH